MKSDKVIEEQELIEEFYKVGNIPVLILKESDETFHKILKEIGIDKDKVELIIIGAFYQKPYLS